MGAFDIELYTKLIADQATGASASSTGSLAQQIAYLIANPSTPTWARMPIVRDGTSPFHTGVAGGVFYAGWFLSNSGTQPIHNLGTYSQASSSTVFDTTNERNYRRNTTGAQGYENLVAAIGVAPNLLHPSGPLGARPAYDLNAGAADMLPPTTLDCMVVEWEATFIAASAAADNNGIGISSAAFSGNAFASATRSIGFYRKTGSGWTVKSADGTTASATSEAADTSDNAKHVFRLEWHNKATDEARLYVDGVLKVTKTTNLPATNTTTLPSNIGWCKPSGAATDDLRVYGFVTYWKDAA